MEIPEDVQYARTHDWLRIEDGIATVGISDYAQEHLTDVVFVELHAPGERLAAGAECAALESVKAVGYLYAPIAGVLQAVNEKLREDPGLINRDPYGEGWIVKLAPSEPRQTVELLTPAEYREFLAREEAK